jgi:hypothetical protein
VGYIERGITRQSIFEEVGVIEVMFTYITGTLFLTCLTYLKELKANYNLFVR